jgi:hypothetical protein
MPKKSQDVATNVDPSIYKVVGIPMDNNPNSSISMDDAISSLTTSTSTNPIVGVTLESITANPMATCSLNQQTVVSVIDVFRRVLSSVDMHANS